MTNLEKKQWDVTDTDKCPWMVLPAKKVWFEKVLLSEITNLDIKVQELSR